MNTSLYLFQTLNPIDLQRSLVKTNGQIEFLIALALFFGSYFGLRLYAKRKNILHISTPKKQTLRLYIKNRLVWPVSLAIVLGIMALSWQLFHPEYTPMWLSFFAHAALWIAVIRVIMTIVQYSFPNKFIDPTKENVIFIALWVCFGLWLTGLGSYMLEWLESIQFNIGKTKLSLLNILSGILWVGIILVLALSASKILESRVMKIRQLDINTRIVINKLISIGVITLAFLIALPMVGIDLTVLSVFGGALGVGLGLGLQKLVGSYISGFVILLERSLRLGDMVTINDKKGIVKQITSRYVVLSAAGLEHLIPNDAVISNTVTNLTLTDTAIWEQVFVQVAYGTDLELALSLAKEAAMHEGVKTDPAPTPFLISFDDSGITISVSFWAKDSTIGVLGLKSDILMNIWRSFKKHNIEMPFPQREVRILNQQDIPELLSTKE